VSCNAQSKHRPQPWGQSVGGVSERAGAKAGGSNLSATTTPSRVVMVKGIPVFRKAALFAGRLRNEDLGRSVRCSGYPPAAGIAPMTTDVRRMPRRGTSSACATKRMHSTDAGITASRSRTRPSLGPSTRARQSSLCTRGASFAWWGDRLGITAGQTHGSGRNQHWGRADGRSAARRGPLSPARERAWHVEKRKEIKVSVPARIKSPGRVARTSMVRCRNR
jgi:hypothetical protein